jgi:hypothetical protein
MSGAQAIAVKGFFWRAVWGAADLKGSHSAGDIDRNE